MDPNEPMFPIRPNEPVCQYFMKHGTCKFGQACKFHHPPPNSVQVISGGQLQMMNIGGPIRKADPSPQLLLNPVGSDPNGQGMVLQFLPQRPDEPDCIYFLKNGRCKYGATCRYHHPIHPQQPRQQVDAQHAPRRQPVQYVTQMVQSYPNQQGQVIMSSDNNPVSFINVDGSISYQIIPGNDGNVSYCVPTTSGSVGVTDQTSSTSSLASSYETAHEHLGDAQWNRSKRSGSGGSLNALQQRNFLPHSASEGNIAQQQQRRSRTDSYGTTSSDHGAQQIYESNSTSTPPGMRRNGSVGSWTQQQRVQGTQYIVRQDPSTGGRPPATLSNAQRRFIRRRSPRGGEGGDEGFTMMTSALLHMLDTPEEAASAESYSDEEYRQHVVDQYQVQQQQQQVDPSMFEQMSLLCPSAAQQQQHGAQGFVDPSMFEQLSLQGHYPGPSAHQESPPPSAVAVHHPRHPGEDRETAWSPTWQESSTNQDDSSTHAMAMMMHHQSPASPGASGSTHDSDVGLYLS